MRTLTNKHLTSSLSRNPAKASLILGATDDVEIAANQCIAQVVGTRGQALLECLAPDYPRPPNENMENVDNNIESTEKELGPELFELQSKLRNLIWIKKGA